MSAVRAWPAAAVLLVAALASAGCLGGGGGGEGNGDGISSTGPPGTATSSTGPTSAPPAPPSVVVDLLPDFAFESCRGISVQSTRPIAEVQALLPEGFTAAPAPFAADGAGLVGMDLYACGNLTTPQTQIPEPYFGMVYTHVLRPSERLADAPEAGIQEYAFRMLAGEDVLARLWPSAGYDTRNGTATVTVEPVSTAVPLDTGGRLGNGVVGEDYRLLASGSPPVGAMPGQGNFARYTALADGSVLVWTGTYAFPAGTMGQGSFAVADDDVFADFEQADAIPGLARLYETGSILDQDLRRFF